MLKSICVYCGSSLGHSKKHRKAARLLAQELVKNNIQLIYGGGKVGLMGVLANEVMQLGGKAIGIIPRDLLDKEKGHGDLTHLHVVNHMHERKALMAKLSDGFIAMSGGIGTLEELLEIMTWAQLQFHKKPIGILNINGFYDTFIQLLHMLVIEGFLSEKHLQLFTVHNDPQELLQQIQARFRQ